MRKNARELVRVKTPPPLSVNIHTSLIFALTAWHGLEKGDTRVKKTLAALPTAAPSRVCSKLEIGSELRPNAEINPA